MQVNPNIQKQTANYKKLKEMVWNDFGGEKEFKIKFPLSTNRSIIYSRVANGENPKIAAKDLQDEINNDLHSHAQQNAKKRHSKNMLMLP